LVRRDLEIFAHSQLRRQTCLPSFCRLGVGGGVFFGSPLRTEELVQVRPGSRLSHVPRVHLIPVLPAVPPPLLPHGCRWPSVRWTYGIQ
jgi:hypothetical protein